jgi:type I restriction enzyme, R subunit
VTFDRESCVDYRKLLGEFLPSETSDIVVTVNSGEDEYASWRWDRDAEEKLHPGVSRAWESQTG